MINQANDNLGECVSREAKEIFYLIIDYDFDN